jgi:hypothetical protein
VDTPGRSNLGESKTILGESIQDAQRAFLVSLHHILIRVGNTDPFLLKAYRTGYMELYVGYAYLHSDCIPIQQACLLSYCMFIDGITILNQSGIAAG